MNKNRIFISYSHGGNGPEWKAKLLRALHVFERQHLLDVWQDGKIRVSSFWDDDVKQAMSSASIAVVLLTKETLESEYVLNTEFPYLREQQRQGQLTIFPVVCEECDWRTQGWLRATQAPNESNPLEPLSPSAQDRIFRDLATDIAKELSRVALAENSAVRSPISESKFYLDKFPLTRGPALREERLIGREQELALLDLAFAQPRTAIVSLVAWGGVGKTMLVQQWLRGLERASWFGTRRVYAWNFYSEGTTEDRQASEDTFLAHALEWFSVQCEPTLSPWDKGRLLADAVARERTLLILDGIEPLQYPPGPMGGQLRAPGVQSLMKRLARKASPEGRNQKPEVGNCLCLVTTREPLSDLVDFQRCEGSSWGSVLRVDLGNLTDEAGAALLHHAGANRAGAVEIKPDDKELQTASREVNGHALTLNLLGRFLARAHQGDIRSRNLVKFRKADLKVQGGTTFKMLDAFEKWFSTEGGIESRALAILKILGLFNQPAGIDSLFVLRKAPFIRGLTKPLFRKKRPLSKKAWRAALAFLSDFQLVAIQQNAGVIDHATLDCHPLIREYFATRVKSSHRKGWRAAHWRLFKYFRDHAPGDTYVSVFAIQAEAAGSLDRANLLPTPGLEAFADLYEAVWHGCEARKLARTFVEVYFARIRRGTIRYSQNQLGAFGSDLAALRSFFKKPWISVYGGIPDRSAAFLKGEVGGCLHALGRTREALQPVKEAVKTAADAELPEDGAYYSGKLCELELELGMIRRALVHARQALKQSRKASNESVAWHSNEALATALFQHGKFSEAGRHFEKQVERVSFANYDFQLRVPERRVWQRICQNGGPDASEIIASCTKVAQRVGELVHAREHGQIDSMYDSVLNIANDELLFARALFYKSVLSGSISKTARRHLQQSVNRLRKAGQSGKLVNGLLTSAWLKCVARNHAGARADLDEAWDIAERGPMRLHMTDIHLYRARLFFREKDYPWKSPQADLAAAEKLINDCGYHRRDEELADARRAILGI